MQNLIKTLVVRHTKSYSHYEASIIFEGNEITAITNNSHAVDALNSDDLIGEGMWFETSEEPAEELVTEILRANSIKL